MYDGGFAVEVESAGVMECDSVPLGLGALVEVSSDDDVIVFVDSVDESPACEVVELVIVVAALELDSDVIL